MNSFVEPRKSRANKSSGSRVCESYKSTRISRITTGRDKKKSQIVKVLLVYCHSCAAGEKPKSSWSPRGNDWRAAYVAYWPSKGARRVAPASASASRTWRQSANIPLSSRGSLPLLVIKPRSRVSESVAREVSRGTNPTFGFRSGRQRRDTKKSVRQDGCAINNAR